MISCDDGGNAQSRSRKPTIDWTWRLALVAVLLMYQEGVLKVQATTANKSPNQGIQTFTLHPTSVLAEQKRQRRQRRRSLLRRHQSNKLSLTTNHTTKSTLKLLLKDRWFHPDNHNAIYATLPKKEDLLDQDSEWYDYFSDDEHLEDFHRYRHLSHYERQYRQEMGLDLNPWWDGVYEYYNMVDDVDTVVEEELISGMARNTTTREHNNVTLRTRSKTRRILQKTGGKFNNYQAVALNQGYGTHYANVWVGSPKMQKKTLIVDTGSHYTAFPCTGCENCGLDHHTGPYFDPQQSDTFHVLKCNECREGVGCQGGRCVFSQSYTEGSSWEAYQVSDKFYCGGGDELGAVDPKDQKYVIDFMFGCQLSLNGLFKTQLADGIMGMSQYETTLTKQMYNKGKLEHNLFGLCYRRELGSSRRGVTAGSMTLGGVTNGLDTSPMIFAKNMATVGFYTVYVKNIFIRANGGQSAMTSLEGHHKVHKVPLNVHKVNSGKGVIVDSGTTDTYLNKNMARAFNKMWKKVTGRDYSHAPISLNNEQLKSLPTILVQCHAYDVRVDPDLNPEDIVGYVGELDPSAPNDLLIAIPATNYMEFSPRTKMYASRVYFTETSGGVLGSNTMQGHNVLFDWENGRIGFAESTCTYDREDVPKEIEDGGFSSDCQLGKAVLSTTCVETVQEEVCANNPSNLELLGTETWTMVVENPGTGSGLSCLDAAKQLSNSTAIDPSTFHCDGHGFCEEQRPCQMPCTSLEKEKGVTELSTNQQSVGSACGDSFWGACDYNCTQSRIQSTPFTDGHCHEIGRVQRACHKDACGRSDPCRVPFMVHAIIVFRGVSVSQWTKTSEDVFMEGLTRAMHSFVPAGYHLFQVGDVKVIIPRKWIPGDDTEDLSGLDGDEDVKELGLKLAVHISIFNPGAQIPIAEKAASKAADNSEESNFGSLVKNFTSTSQRKSEQPTVCQDSDLFSLAKLARLVAYEVPEKPEFMPRLIDEMEKIESQRKLLEKSVFSPVYQREEFARESHLVSSWTIRTDVDDEINYFGPPEPFFFTFLRYVHRIALITFCFSLFVFIWGVAIQSMDVLVAAYNSGRNWIPGFKSREPSYASLDTCSDDDIIGEEMNASAGSVFESSSIRRRVSMGRAPESGMDNSSNSIELTMLKASPGTKSTPKKRRNSGTPDNDGSSKGWQLSHQMTL